MARRKYKKHRERTGKYGTELVGVILIIISILGLFILGPIGKAIQAFTILIAGNLFFTILLLILYTGLYMIIKRETPRFFTIRFVGLYFIILAILMYLNIGLIEASPTTSDALGDSLKNLLLAFSDGTKESYAGGMLGSLSALAAIKLFSATGAYIIVAAFIVVGIILLFDVSLSDTIKSISKGFKKVFGKVKEGHDGVDETANKYENDNKVIISSIDELTHMEEKKDNDPATGSPKINEFVGEYTLPPISLLEIPKKDQTNTNQTNVKANIEVLEKVLNDFDVSGKVVEVHIGPSVTQYEVELKAGTKVNKVLSIHREISLALAAKDVRIQAPIPGKNTIGIELPNKVNTPVSLREVLVSIPNSLDSSKLLVGLGKDIMGKAIYAEINKTPHLLVAGATGSGKSVCINTIINSLLMRTKPDEVKLILIDPKKVELSIYNGIPHLMAPVVTDPKKASIALMKIVSEMENRYDMFTDTETKNIAGYNLYVENKNKHLPDNEKLKKLPFIVVIIDELADLMLIAAKEVEDSIMRITQMARAAGIHLIVATQRPSTDVITGIIKANIPSRISFAVSSNVDSRTILDMGGGEKLLGKGDMLFLPMGENTPIRLQGSFISEEEIKKVIDYTVKQQKVQYDEKLSILDTKQIHHSDDQEEYDDPLYNEIVEFAIRNGKISASLIQRKYRFGYNRAARVIDLLEERGIIGPSNGSKPREVLVQLEEDSDN
ncbi:MAG: DNA translocase FtsK 4TM domain-containing protein [Bacilli bacterium]|nr:DNA translocase FtsK 4TM domain-containing protein [Bacilli bacterium]